MKTAFLVLLLHVSSVHGVSRFGCMSVDSFNQNVIGFFSKDIGEDVTKKNMTLLDAVMEKSIGIGSGSFGEVSSVAGQNPPLAVKIVNPPDSTAIKAVKEEIKMLKEVCGESFDENSTQLISCEGKEIAAFKGCVEYQSPRSLLDYVYIFQREGYSTMNRLPLSSKYKGRPAIKQAVMIMRILEKVASLHRKGIVHSDIKPENIVIAKSDLKEFELIDLGMTRRAGSEFIGGTLEYISPEYWDGKKILAPELDVYSIAITLLNLEGDFTSFVHRTYEKHFGPFLFFNSYSKIPESCHKKITDAVLTAFQFTKTGKVFARIFQKALAYRAEDRYSSALELLVDIVDNLYLIPGYKGYLYDLIKRYTDKKEEENKKKEETKVNQPLGEGPSSTLRWEEIAISLGYDAKPPGLVEKAKKLFLCGAKNETPKPPAWKREKDMPEYLIPILKKKYKEEFNAKFAKQPQAIEAKDIKLKFPEVNKDLKDCAPCFNDDDDVEVEKDEEREKAIREFQKNLKEQNLLGSAIWVDKADLEKNKQQQQQII